MDNFFTHSLSHKTNKAEETLRQKTQKMSMKQIQTSSLIDTHKVKQSHYARKRTNCCEPTCCIIIKTFNYQTWLTDEVKQQSMRRQKVVLQFIINGDSLLQAHIISVSLPARGFGTNRGEVRRRSGTNHYQCQTPLQNSRCSRPHTLPGQKQAR